MGILYGINLGVQSRHQGLVVIFFILFENIQVD